MLAKGLPLAVFGASGQVGRAVLDRCREHRIPVLAFSRETGHADEEWIQWRQARLPDVVPAMPRVAATLSLGPLDLFSHWLERARPDGIGKIVALGSMSAISKRDSALPAERDLARRLRESEERLARACTALGLGWTVFRPTLIYGAGVDRNVSAVMRAAARWHVMPLPRARGLRQPLHVADLADAVLASLNNAASDGCVLPIGGGERLDVATMFRRMRAALPVATLPLPLPATVSRMARMLSARMPLAAKLARFEDDLVANNDMVEQMLGVQPRAFTPAWLPP